LISSWISGFWNSASAISAAFFIDCAATPALPDADSGSTSPTLTPPVPTACGCCGGPEGSAELNGFEIEPMPAQAPSRGAPRIRPSADRRVAPDGDHGKDLEGPDLGSSGPTIASLLLAGPGWPVLQPPGHQGGGFRHIVDE
jgi:hypothetical protein